MAATGQLETRTETDGNGQQQDPARFIVAALRLFACPCSAPLHETLREGSPAAHLLTVMRIIDRHARRPLRLNPGDCRDLTRDEIAFVALIASCQQDRQAEFAMRCRTIVRSAGQRALMDRVTEFGRKLARDGITLPEPEVVPPPAGCSMYPPVLTNVKREIRTSTAG